MENNRRPENMERITTAALAEAFIDEQLKALRAQIDRDRETVRQMRLTEENGAV